MPRTRVCLECGAPCSGSRCPRHHGRHHNPAYDSYAWRKLRERTLTAWRAEHGNLCPGYQRAPHQATTRLTVDHVVPLAMGGSLTGEVRVLCSSCNTRASNRMMPRGFARRHDEDPDG